MPENKAPQNDPRKLILKTLTEKSAVKQQVYDHTLASFNQLKEVLKELVDELNKPLKKTDPRIMLAYKDRGHFEAEIKVAGDLLIFNMHSNVHQFDTDHWIYKSQYVKQDNMRSYSGIISIYNFLADSFKYNRRDDVGYMIGRIFINKERHYFVEGKRQLGFLYHDIGQDVMDKKAMKRILESAILYSLDFDLLVPDYNNIAFATVEQMQERINKSKTSTGKRLGFRFQADKDEV
jgi:hypothetical protein